MSQSVSRLKELLFDRENATLNELQTRLLHLAAAEQLSREELARQVHDAIRTEAGNRAELAARLEALLSRTGSDEALRASVAGILDGAFRDAEVNRHDQLSRAIAPVVVKTIKTELRNSQDEMVEALYPITGRLVKSYVASAMRDLADRINRRLAGGSNPIMLRLRSLLSGRPVGDLAIADLQRLEVTELFLIRRGSGQLLQHWPDSANPDQGLSNSNIHLSGVLAAINDFASQTLKDDGGALRSFSLDDFHIYLRGSPGYLLAAKCRGVPPAGVEQILDDEFLRLLERNSRVLREDHSSAMPAVLSPLATNLGHKLEEQHRNLATETGLGFNPLKILAYGLAIPLLLVAGWVGFTRFETSQVERTVTQAIESIADLRGYTLQVQVAPRGRAVTLTGLVPSTVVKSELLGRVRSLLKDVTVDDRLAAVPNQGAEFETQVARLQRELAGLESETVRSSVRRALSRAIKSLDVAIPELHRLNLELLDASARNTVDSISGLIDRVGRDLRQLHSRIAAGPFDISQINSISTPMHAVTLNLHQVTSDLATLLSKGSQGSSAAHGEAAPSDVTESAEVLGIAAGQVATMAVAVAQSASVKPAPALPLSEPTPIEKLQKWVRSNAVFFGDGIDYRAPASTEATLNEAARFITNAGVLVRIIGYTDERGAQVRNVSLAQQRAQRVVDALVERGVPKQLLVAVGRPAGLEITSSVGPQSANRRVEFEIGFNGEAAAQ